MGYELDIEGIVEPDEIIWDNIGITGTSQGWRWIATYIMTFFLLALTTVSSLYMNGLAQLVD